MPNQNVPKLDTTGLLRMQQRRPDIFTSPDELPSAEHRIKDRMVQAFACSTIPEDIKRFAQRNNLGAWIEIVWAQAFQRGFVAACEQESRNDG